VNDSHAFVTCAPFSDFDFSASWPNLFRAASVGKSCCVLKAKAYKRFPISHWRGSNPHVTVNHTTAFGTYAAAFSVVESTLRFSKYVFENLARPDHKSLQTIPTGI
jgi:hypothetical protein